MLASIKFGLIGLAVTLASCSTIPVAVPLPVPPPLELPTVPSVELSCLSDKAYTVLVIRDRLQAARIDTLTSIILTTHPDNN